MPDYRYRIVNVFTTEEKLSGNPLCVFEDARGMSHATMQALAQQFNLSETTFVLPSSIAPARIRTFTPAFEMSFAGHPTLGSAHVVRELLNTGNDFALETGVGPIALHACGDIWRLQANAPVTRKPALPAEEVAQLLGLSASDLAAPPLWVNTGNDQLLINVREAAALARCRADAAGLKRLGEDGPAAKVYLWATENAGTVRARFFFATHAGVMEDPGTGSACANLGGYLVATNATLPIQLTVHQGEFLRRPNRLRLEVDANKRIFVSGRVIVLGAGSVTL
jgi:trans-2,3-dihydro-3-hydroxyanthranilate isomerase